MRTEIYHGWRVVFCAFAVAFFGWGLGFYGQSVYVAELHRLHGWPTSLISSGTTLFYLSGAVLVAFVPCRLRPTRCPRRRRRTSSARSC